jgi:Mn-dependent DtxR family transcriptional regulator
MRGIKMEEIEKGVLEAMKKAGKPVRPGDVAKSMDMDSKEISKVIDSLKKKGMVVSPKRCYYAPADC